MVHENKNEHHCHLCEKAYKYKWGLARHIKDVHKKQDEAQIEHCNAADTEKPNLQKHGKTVREKTDVACGNVANTNLTTDIHHCDMCEKTYKYKRGLVRHIKNIHEKDTNVKDKLQNPISIKTPNLNEHPKVHRTNTGDFCCDPCKKTYRYKGNLEKHIK